MKHIFIVLSLLPVPLLAAAENKIKMVTYFPVPYVAYSKINASKQLDVGLTSACEMNLGCSESGALGIRPLQATTVNLNRGKLDLNTASAVKSTDVMLGSGSGEANIDFIQNLRIGTLNNGYSLEAADMTVDELKLFASHMKSGGEKFPSCAATGASGAPQVSWQKVKLKKAEEVYLVCGNPGEVSKCEPTHNGQETYTETCPSGQTGSIRYTWDYDACTYRRQSTCTAAAQKKCIVAKEWKEFEFEARIQTVYDTSNCVGMIDFATYQANIKCGDYSIPQAYTDCKLGEDCPQITPGYYIYDIWAIPDLNRNVGPNSWMLKKVGIYCVKIDLVAEDACLEGVDLSSPPPGEHWYRFDC